MRCDSPPESVEASRSSVRYSRPTSFRNFSRCCTCSRIFPAISICSPESLSSLKNTAACSTVNDVTSQMFLPSILICRASRRRRAPQQSGHCAYPRYRLLISDVTILAFKLLREADLLGSFVLARRGLKDDFAGFAVSQLDCIYNPRALVRRNRDAVHQRVYRLAEINIQQRFRRREFK